MQAYRDVLESSHFTEQFEVLECPANSGAGALGGRVASDIPRAKMQRPAADPVHAGNEIEQRGLTGAIGPNHTMAADGYTLMGIPSGHAVAAALYKSLPYRTIDDFTMDGASKRRLYGRRG